MGIFVKNNSILSRRVWVLLLTWFLIALLPPANAANSSINIALLIYDPSQDPAEEALVISSIIVQNSVDTIQAYQYWAELANQAGGITVGNDTMMVNLTVINIGSWPSKQTQIARQALDSKQYHFFFGPFGSDWTVNVAKAFVGREEVLFAGSALAYPVFRCPDTPLWRTIPECRYPGARRFDNVWGMAPTDTGLLSSLTETLALRGAKSMSAFYQSENDLLDTYSRNLANGGLLSAQEAGMESYGVFALPVNATDKDYEDLVTQLSLQKPDIVLGGTNALVCANFLRAAKKLNYLPQAFITSGCLLNPELELQLIQRNMSMADAMYLIDWNSWDYRLKGPEFVESPKRYFYDPNEPNAPKVFWKKWQARFNATSNLRTVPNAMGMAIALELVIGIANSIQTKDIVPVLPSMKRSSAFGYLGWNGWGQNDVRSLAFIQSTLNSTAEIIAPLSSITAVLIYPMPTWKERIFVKTHFDDVTEQIVAALVGFAAIFTIVMGVLTFIYRNDRVIIASSPLFLFLILLGAMMVYASIITWTLTLTDVECNITWWLSGIGFILMFASLLVKVWRISVIFNSKDLKVIRVSNRDLVLVVGGAVTVEIILLLVLVVGGKIRAEVHSIDINRPALGQFQCTQNLLVMITLIMLGAYKLLLIIVGCWLSIRTWKIKIPLYNESRSVAFCMYNIFCFMLVAALVELLSNQPGQFKGRFVARSVAILLGVFIPIVVLFIPKFYKGISNESVHSPDNSGDVEMSAWSPDPVISEEAPGTPVDVRKLKTRIKSLKKKVKSLQEQLDSSKITLGSESTSTTTQSTSRGS